MDKPTQPDTSRTEDTVVQLYWATLETWSMQVDSYWTRTNYFAAFETAAIAGTWVLLGQKDLRLAHWSILLAVLLTLGWIFSNLKSHDYVRYWWAVLQEIELRDEWIKKPVFISQYENRRKKHHLLLKIPYSFFTNWLVPLFFLSAWVLLLVLNWNGTCDK